jgi:hypothetical protein
MRRAVETIGATIAAAMERKPAGVIEMSVERSAVRRG